MNPENVTTSQLLGSFTAKHWTIAFSTLFTIIGTAVTGGYWVGQKITETQVVRLQAKLEISQSEIKRLSTVNGQWQDAYNKAQELITKRDQEVTQLKTHLDKENSCSFIHEQILATSSAIEAENNVMSLMFGKDQDDNTNRQKAVLEKRLENYQQQLGSCNK